MCVYVLHVVKIVKRATYRGSAGWAESFLQSKALPQHILYTLQKLRFPSLLGLLDIKE